MQEAQKQDGQEISDLDPFSYELPTDLIAQEPLPERSDSRLLYLQKSTGLISHNKFPDIVGLLKPGDTLVLNDTRVIPARLIARRQSGGTVQLLLLKARVGAPSIWEAMVSPIKRLKPGDKLELVNYNSEEPHFITIIEIGVGFDGFKRLIVDLGGNDKVWRILDGSGFAPLPPYIVRKYAAISDKETGKKTRSGDLDRYQTVFAKQPGAVAAPTAGLHFSETILQELQNHGVNICYLTLHVGAGTFKPIATSLMQHQMEPESFTIPERTATLVNQTRAAGGRVVAVGTTSLRALEAAGREGQIAAIENGTTDLYIKPGYKFQVVDGLITNFHVSRSSLLVLVTTFAGFDQTMLAYGEAVKNQYRFFSYGDAMLII